METPELRSASLRFACAAIAVWVAGIGCRSAARAPAGSTGAVSDRQPLQALFRAEASRGDESARLRLTLKRWSDDRFDLRAADALGRGAWALAVAGGVGVWSDLRDDWRCRFPASTKVRLDDVSLPLPSRSLAALLLGGAPVAAWSEEAWRGGGEIVEEDGRTWRLRRDAAGRVVAWELRVGGRLRLSWEEEDSRRRLRSPEPAFEIEWREVAREPLAAAAPDLAAEAASLEACPNGRLP